MWAAFGTGCSALLSLLAVGLWPSPEAAPLEHEHTGLHDGHPHPVDSAPVTDGRGHIHGFVADELHTASLNGR
ncbi:hypothetical protein [Streptomyces sp. NPDC093568]|uniref:hypothetical protein n=1 Tax=Streptomyces sp. NPDC093568 TaxID=3366041 RepID=UPI00381545EB